MPEDHEQFTDLGVQDVDTGIELKIGNLKATINYDDAQALSDMLYILLDDIRLEKDV